MKHRHCMARRRRAKCVHVDAALPTAAVPGPEPLAGGRKGAATAATSGAAQPGVSADQIGWRDFFTDPHLAGSDRDCTREQPQSAHRHAERDRLQAQFRIQRGDLFPAIPPAARESSRSCPRTVPYRSGGVERQSGGSSPSSGTGATTFRYYTAPESASPTTNWISSAGSAA